MTPVLAVAALYTLFTQEPGARPKALAPRALAAEHESHRFVTTPAPCFTPEQLAESLQKLAATHPSLVTVEVIGRSFLDREIRMVSIGRGRKTILLWSQMHGDEPSATPALLDLADYLARESSRPEIARILDTFTLRMIPQLNPDGSSAYERRNAQGIDINRDALMLTTPEGRLLKEIRDRYRPMLGFNLHDQNRRVTVGSSGVLSSISLLAVSGDEKGTLTPGRLRAKRVAGRIVEALSPFIQGGIARYDEDWNPRAFGDNVTAWGTPVVLIESGGFPKGGAFPELTRLNFVALMSVLDGLVRTDLAEVPVSTYDRLRRNQSDAWADVAIVGATFLEPRSRKWFSADLAFDVLATDQTLSGCSATPRTGSRIVEVGDSRVATPGRKIDGRGILLAPLSRDHRLKSGEIAGADLMALKPGATPVEEPKALLASLELAATGLTRGAPAHFIAFVPDAAGGAGRYFVVIDGVGLPEGLK